MTGPELGVLALLVVVPAFFVWIVIELYDQLQPNQGMGGYVMGDPQYLS